MSNNININSAPRGFPDARTNPVLYNTSLLIISPNSSLKKAMLKGQSTSQVNAAIQYCVNTLTQSLNQVFTGIASVIKNKNNNDDINNKDTSVAQQNKDSRQQTLDMFPQYI
jgi:hypothetical protein